MHKKDDKQLLQKFESGIRKIGYSSVKTEENDQR